MQREASFKPGGKKNSQRERGDRTLKIPPVILEKISSPHVPDCWTQTLEQGNDSFSQITVTARLRVHISLDRRAHSTFPLLICNNWWSQVGLSSSFEPYNLTERGRKAKKNPQNFFSLYKPPNLALNPAKIGTKKWEFVSDFLNLLSQPHSKLTEFKMEKWGLPWWCSGWESACQCRRHGFEPWSGKIPHTAEQLGPWATEPAQLEPVLHNKRGRDSERPPHCDEEWSPLATTRENPRTETKTQHSQK